MTQSKDPDRREIRIATRASPLALWQAEHVAALASVCNPHIQDGLAHVEGARP